MKKYILFGGCLLLLAYITSCDDGRIYEKTETLSEEGRTLRMSGRISGINKWPDGYSVVVAGFSDESEYAVVTKTIPAVENDEIQVTMTGEGSTLMERRDVIPGGDQVARMLDFSLDALRGAGYAPYYLYRQKYMSGSLENVGWARPGTESLYNIVMMEELQTVVSIGGGGVTKLVDPAAGRILRLPNPKYPHDYLAARDKILSQKDEIVSFYGG